MERGGARVVARGGAGGGKRRGRVGWGCGEG